MSPGGFSAPLVTGALFSLALVAIFLAAGGMQVSIGALYESLAVWPVGAVPTLGPQAGAALFDLLGRMLVLALALGAPLLIAMFLGEAILALASRFAVRLNVFDSALAVKNLIFVAILPPYLYLLATRWGEGTLDLPGLIETLRRMVAP